MEDSRDLFMVKFDYPSPQYDIAQVSSCDACPTYPSDSSTSHDIIGMIGDILQAHETTVSPSDGSTSHDIIGKIGDILKTKTSK